MISFLGMLLIGTFTMAAIGGVAYIVGVPIWIGLGLGMIIGTGLAVEWECYR